MKPTSEPILLSQPIGRIIGHRKFLGQRKREQRSGTCFFVRGAANRTLAVTASHVLRDVDDVEIEVVQNATGTSIHCSHRLTSDQVIHTPTGSGDDLCFVDVTDLELVLLQSGFGSEQLQLHVEMSDTANSSITLEYQFCSFVQEDRSPRATILTGTVGVDPADPTTPATLRIEESGELVFVGMPPKGTSGSPVWAIDDKGQCHFIGMLTSRCKSDVHSIDGLPIVLPRESIITFIESHQGRPGACGK